MKPLSLTLRAFGAYAGEHTVPFQQLAAMGLFTVTGPTGSGKTTLFDAMAYALYGGLPPLEAYPPEQRGAIEEQRAKMPAAQAAPPGGPARDRA